MNENRFATHSLKDPRILRILSAAMKAVDPADAVKKHVPKLFGNVYGLGIGKASIPMLNALAELYPLSGALAISKHASSGFDRFPVILGDHPIPGKRSVHAGDQALEFVSSLGENDILVCLISGGGSALMTAPIIPLDVLQKLTSMLMACSADIEEINTLRRQLDRVKGGGLARATKAKVISLILSDVIGNPLEAIASGPTYPNPTTTPIAINILEKYFSKGVIESELSFITLALYNTNEIQIENNGFPRVENIIVGDNHTALSAVLQQARVEEFNVEILENGLRGEAKENGVRLARKLAAEAALRTRPFCMIAGGETTVTLQGKGRGGRNQELALAAVDVLTGTQELLLIALSTDGEDGPTDAAGAVVTSESAQRGESLGLSASKYLSRNDSYHYFQSLGDLIQTGPSGTNVNDLVLLFGL